MMARQSKLLLVGESFAPWTKKARWALECCGLTYEYEEYTPTLSEPGLRWRLRQWRGSVSVPVLFTSRKVLRGSWEIACYASECAGDGRLGIFRDAVKEWNDLSESALAEGRTAVVRRIYEDDRALEEALPGFVPGTLRPVMRFLARDAVGRLDRKYAHLVQPGALRGALIRLREGLAEAGGDYLLGAFSYADITMAAVVEVFAPVAITEPPLGPATSNCWNSEELAVEFEDLLHWRDRLAKNEATSYSQFKGHLEL